MPEEYCHADTQEQTGGQCKDGSFSKYVTAFATTTTTRYR